MQLEIKTLSIPAKPLLLTLILLLNVLTKLVEVVVKLVGEGLVKIKGVVTENGTLPVLILDGHSEILEFDDLEKAEETRQMLQENSDSGHTYTIRTIK